MSLAHWQTEFIAAVQRAEPGGYSVYHNNLMLTQRASLATIFPTVLAMLGEETFASAAQQYFTHFGRDGFDWGAYGVSFPEFLAQQATLLEYPYIAEVAQYELAVHQVNRLPNKPFNQASVGILQKHSWREIYLDFAPGTQLLPLVFDAPFITQAHQTPEHIPNDFFGQSALLVNTTFLLWRPELATQTESVNSEFLALWQFALTIPQPNLQALAEFAEEQQLDLMAWLQHLMQHKQLFRCYCSATESGS